MPLRRLGSYAPGPDGGRELMMSIRGAIKETPGTRMGKVHGETDRASSPQVSDAALWEDGSGDPNPRKQGLLEAAQSDAVDAVVLVSLRPSRSTRNTGRFPINVFVFDARDGRLLQGGGDNTEAHTIVSRLLGQL